MHKPEEAAVQPAWNLFPKLLLPTLPEYVNSLNELQEGSTRCWSDYSQNNFIIF